MHYNVFRELIVLATTWTKTIVTGTWTLEWNLVISTRMKTWSRSVLKLYIR